MGRLELLAQHNDLYHLPAGCPHRAQYNVCGLSHKLQFEWRYRYGFGLLTGNLECSIVIPV